jgi:hypothetical protein
MKSKPVPRGIKDRKRSGAASISVKRWLLLGRGRVESSAVLISGYLGSVENAAVEGEEPRQVGAGATEKMCIVGFPFPSHGISGVAP